MDEFPEDVEATSIGPLSGGPLAGVTVLEVSSVVMAPLAGRILAKLGAVVTRVEPPGGDVIRRSGAARHPDMAGTHLSLGDGKRNIAIDLGSAEGQAELRQLIAGCDLIVTNHLPRRRHQFGLDWKSIELVNPRAILCTAQGYASSSDLADEPAYDDTVQAASGTCDIFAKSGGGPRYAPYLMANKVAGLTLVYSALAALHYRDRTGQGQWVDVPMIDALADFNLVEQLNEFTFDPPLGEPGWHRTLAPTRVPHPSMDGWICILPYSDRNWADFLRLWSSQGRATGSVAHQSRAECECRDGARHHCRLCGNEVYRADPRGMPSSGHTSAASEHYRVLARGSLSALATDYRTDRPSHRGTHLAHLSEHGLQRLTAADYSAGRTDRSRPCRDFQ